jgi:hypothetical protein
LRDYDKNPIAIKDYGAMFVNTFIFTLLMIAVSYVIANHIEEDLERVSSTIRVIGAILGIFYFSHVLFIQIPKNFKKNPSFFKFSNDEIYYCELCHEYKNEKIVKEITIQTKYIKQISFCVVSEMWKRYGRKHYLSSWGLFRKSSIAIPLTKLFSFVNYLCTYVFFALPFKIYKIKKTDEPLSLLSKNVVIEFTNRNYLVVNVYSEKDFNKLIMYFRDKNISVKDKTVFMYHWQILDPTFFDEEEQWCDEYEPQKIEKKTGIVKRIFGLFGDKK